MIEQELMLKILEMAKMPTPNQQKYKDLLASFTRTMLKFQKLPQELKSEAISACAAIALKMDLESPTSNQ